MKTIICALALIFCLGALGAVTWTAYLYDSYGDGWNGGTLDLYVNGSLILTELTVQPGNTFDTYSFQVEHGDQITTIYTPGDFSFENEYRFYNQFGSLVYSNGAGNLVPTSLVQPFIAQVLSYTTCVVGTGAIASYLPINPFYGYSYTQSLYLRSELPANLESRRISKLRFHWNGGANAPNSTNWTVYIGQTAQSTFSSSSNWLPLSQMTQVFSGNLRLGATDAWIDLPLEAPFVYDGSSNLVVAVDENTGGYDSSLGKFLMSAVTGTRGLVYYSDSTNPDPASPPAAHTQLSQIANISFEFNPRPYLPYAESFGQSAIPSSWTQGYSAPFTQNIWSYSATTNAGGVSGEMRGTWQTGTGVSRLISPPIESSDLIQLNVSFQHFFDDYGPGCTAKLQYSHDLQTWYDVGWSYASGGGDTSGLVEQIIWGPFPPTTYVAWTLDGNHYQYDFWYLDNVSINRERIDAAALSIDLAEVVDDASFTPRGTVKNLGANPASFTVVLGIGNGLYAQSQTVSNLQPGSSQQVTFGAYTPYASTGNTVSLTTFVSGDNVDGNDRVEQALWCIDLDRQGYADCYHYSNPALEGPSTFSLKTPGSVTHLGAPSQMGLFMAGGDWIGNHWYGTEYSDATLSTDNYWRVDHLSGAATLLGESGAPLHGIAWDEENGVLYGTDGSNLYTVNRYTGFATLVGSHVNAYLMISLAYSSTENRLFGVDIATDKLYWIETATGLATEIGLLGVDINFGQDLAMDRDRNLLFLAGYTMEDGYGARLYWIQTYTGRAFKIGNFPAGTQMVGFAIPYDAGIPDVSIAAGGTLSWTAIPGATEYKVYGATTPYPATWSYLGSTPSTSWIEPGGMQAKRFYQVTAVRQSRAGAFGVPALNLGLKDPLTGELLDPQPELELPRSSPTGQIPAGIPSPGPARH